MRTAPVRRAWIARLRTPFGWTVGIYSGVSLLLWGLPLFNLLHAESSAVIAGVAFFTAGLVALGSFGQAQPFGAVLRRQEAATLVPWALLTLTLLWVPNCGYGQGLLFYGLFVPVSVALAVSLAYAVDATRWRFKRTIFVGIGLSLVVLGSLYDLGLHPQFYVYNHVFGGVLGPIYDEELAIRPGLWAFRGLTVLWAALVYSVGRHLRLRRAGRAVPSKVGPGGSAAGRLFLVLGIGACYVFAVPLGINTTERHIQRSLGGVYQTPHFDLYYDPTLLSDEEVRVLAQDHEFRYAQLAQRLRIEVPTRIASYLYPDAETKARLTGARTTNVAPVWLHRPQVHVLMPAFERVFTHELAHVFSREFGLPLLNASLSVGLVEGLAVALEPPDGLPSPHEQVAAATMQRLAMGRIAAPDLAANLAPRLTPLGFWMGRGAVSYTTMGSFVRYLLDTYGPDPIKQVYARGDFEVVYGKPVDLLAEEWQQFVLGRPFMDRTTGALVSARFSVPSLFEKRCPHYVPPYRQRYRQAIAVLAAEDTVEAMAHIEAALAEQPAYQPALAVWAQLKLAAGEATEVRARLDTLALDRRSPALSVRLGDAYALAGRPDEARSHYEEALGRLPGFAREQIALVVMRKSLADESEIMHILTSGTSFEERARRLESVEAAPAAQMYSAFYWARDARFEQAAARLRTTPAALDTTIAFRENVVYRQRLVWLAQWTYRAGDLDEAASYAREAAQAFRADAAFNAADERSDFEAKMVWIQGERDNPES